MVSTQMSRPPSTQEDGRARPARRELPASLKSSATLATFVVVFVALSLWLGGEFLNVNSRLYDIHQNVPLLILGLAATSVLAVNQFDLSVGAIATLVAYLSIGLDVNQGIPLWLSILICLAIGAACGLINAFLVMRLQMNAFIATIGTSGVFIGLSRVYSHGTVLAPTSLPSWFSGQGGFGSFGTKAPVWLIWALLGLGIALVAWAVVRGLREQSLPGTAHATRIALPLVCVVLAVLLWPHLVHLVPWTVLVLLVVSVAMWVLFTRTVFGRSLFATGGNARAARLAGVNVVRKTTMAFVLSGVLSAVAGVILAANQGSISVDVAQPLLLPAYTGAFLSTVLFSKGRLNVPGAVAGGVFVVWIRQALTIGGVSFTWADVVNGGILIAAIGASRIFSRQRAR